MDADALESAVVALVAALPELPVEQLRTLATAADAVAAALAPAPAALAGALAAVLRRYADRAAPLEGWGLVASAAHTLARAAAGGGDHTAALTAARFELDSLASPVAPRPAAPSTPDVPIISLRRRT